MTKKATEPRQLVLFYAALDPETRIVVQQRTTEIRGLMRRAAQDIVDMGLKLIEVRDRLEYGRFEEWIGAEFDWTRQTAYRFINVAERFGGCNNLLQVAPSALYLLSAPSTPEPARQEALDRATAGEPITHATAKQIVAAHVPPAPPEPPPPPPAPPPSPPPEEAEKEASEEEEDEAILTPDGRVLTVFDFHWNNKLDRFIDPETGDAYAADDVRWQPQSEAEAELARRTEAGPKEPPPEPEPEPEAEPPSLIGLWRAGAITAPEAAAAAHLPYPEQERLVAAGPAAVKARVAELEAKAPPMPPSDPAAEKKAQLGERWHKAMHDLWMTLNSVRDCGGLAELASRWNPEGQAATAAELRQINSTIVGWIEVLEELARKRKYAEDAKRKRGGNG